MILMLPAQRRAANTDSFCTLDLIANIRTCRVKQLIEADVIGPVTYVSGQIFVKMPEDDVRTVCSSASP